MKAKLPKYIVNSIKEHSTSLGDHPSFPPDDEESFLLKTVNNFFSGLCERINIDDISELRKELGKLISKCQKLENGCKEALEDLSLKIVNNLFNIPENTISIDAKLVGTIDNKSQRMIPEKTDDFEFDSIDDMNGISDEIYKRRMLDALVAGSSMFYTLNMDMYIADLFKISPELPSLYVKILEYNNLLVYFEKDTLSNEGVTEAGSVDVYIQQTENPVNISAKGIIFPCLLSELIKGFNELAISHGLPEDLKKAEYIIKKSDFKLAEMWDLRLGLPLWLHIVKAFDKIECDVNDIGVNFFFMEISCLSPYDFNNLLKEVFANTKKGLTLLKDIVDKITEGKEQDEFDDYMNNMKNQKYQLSDSEYFSPEELNIDYV